MGATMTSEAVRRLADKYMLETGDRLPPRPRRPDPPVPAPPPVDEADAELLPGRVRWSGRRLEMWRRWGLVALYVAGPKGPVPRGIGDNSLGWPLRIGKMQGRTFADNVTRIMDSYSPYHWQGVWFRVWAPSEAHQKRLAGHVIDRLIQEDPAAPAGTIEGEIARWAHWARAESMRHSWYDVGPEPDFYPWLRDAAIEEDLGLRPMPVHADAAARRERRFKIVRAKLERAIHELAHEQAIETWSDEAALRQLDIWEAAEAQREVGER
jgi:hypothetical protein